MGFTNPQVDTEIDPGLFVPYTGATSDVDLGDNKLTIDTVALNLAPPASASGVFDYASGDIQDDGYTHAIRVYSYVTVDGEKVYSLTYRQATPITDSSTSLVNYEVDWSWAAVTGADGYFVAINSDYFGYNYEVGVDVATNSWSMDTATGTTSLATPTPREVSKSIEASGDVDIDGRLALGVPLDEIYGGTGNAIYAAGDILYASTTTNLLRLARPVGNSVLHCPGSGAPQWAQISLTGGYVTGITQNYITYGSASNTLATSINLTFSGTVLNVGAGAHIVRSTIDASNPTGVATAYTSSMTTANPTGSSVYLIQNAATAYDTTGSINQIQLTHTSGSNIGSVNTAVFNDASANSSQTTNNLFGSFNRARQYGAGTIAKAVGGVFGVDSYGSGQITSAYGIEIGSFTKGSTGDFVNKYGVYVNDIAGGTSLNYSLYTNAGNILLNGGGDANSDLTLKTDNYNAIFSDASNDSMVLMSNIAGKLGFWGATAITQPASANQAALTNSTGGSYDGTLVDVATTGVADPAKVNDNFTDVYTVVNEMRNVLVNTGLMKGAA